MDDVNRFWLGVARGLPDDCWPWIRGRFGAVGYGAFVVKGRTMGAHRFALELKLGRAMERSEVTRHACHNRLCCNPRHLSLGTPADNFRDRTEAGRPGIGGKLSVDAIAEIRASAGRWGDASRLAEKFGVSRTTISHVRNGVTWKAA